MAYCYEYINKLEQFGISMFNLKLTDTDGILPDVLVPISLYKNEISEEKLNDIARDIIAKQTEIQSANIIKPIEIIESDINIDTNVIVEEQQLPVENNPVDNTLLSDSKTTENALNTDII
jgi:hypothetical protein